MMETIGIRWRSQPKVKSREVESGNTALRTSHEVKLFSTVFLKICFILSPEGSYKKKIVFLLHNSIEATLIAAGVVKCGATKLERKTARP